MGKIDAQHRAKNELERGNPMDIIKEAFSCRRERFAVRGFEYKSQRHNGIPVIMSHAFSNQKIMKKYAEALAGEGQQVDLALSGVVYSGQRQRGQNADGKIRS